MEQTEVASANPPFAFRRLGGMNQFVLQTDEEWRNLHDLDKKLWMALSCPIRGLEFSSETLELLDGDKDGRIRVQDVKEAVDWLCERLAHPSRLADGQAEVELANINTAAPAGEQLKNAAEIVLKKQENPDSGAISLAELETVVAEANGYPFNGDGIVPPDSAPLENAATPIEKNMANYIRAAISIIGAKKDASGKPGLDESLVSALNAELAHARDWRAKLRKANLPLGENTAAAWNLFSELHAKIDDFFCRCGLLSYAPDAGQQINDEQLFLQTTQSAETGGLLQADNLAKLPLARANADSVLNLAEGLNPVWAEKAREFAKLVEPLAQTASQKLTEAEWKKIKTAFSEYSAILADKPNLAAAAANAEPADFVGYPALCLASSEDGLGRAFMPVNPNDALGTLTDAEIAEMLSPETAAAFQSLVEKDKAAPPLTAFLELRKLALFHAHLYTFLNNFLSFTDFYSPDKKAIFQSGTLYLDGRACFLCVPVEDVDNHARLAEQSHLCLIYCECQRKESDGAADSMKIAAALTEGNVATLIDGRHGLFIDNAGKEWDTKIIRVVHNPISLEEAVWAPYIRFANMISEQIHKFVESKNQAIADKAAAVAADPTAAAKDAAAQPKAGFDFAKGAGIFAALSVAVSMLSAAFAYIANSLASLGWLWPLALVLVFVCISGPSVVLAWFKLRKRGLGSLLDASDWAVNNEAPINLIMGATLTKRAKLPADARKELNDPYAVPAEVLAQRRRRRNWLIFWFWVLVGMGIFALYCYFWQTPQWLTDSCKSITDLFKAK